MKNVARESRLMTDEAPYYPAIGTRVRRHNSVNHSADEYVRGDGAYQHGRELLLDLQARDARHLPSLRREALHRYLAEFDFRYNHRSGLGVTDAARANAALRGIKASASPIGGLVSGKERKRKLTRKKLNPILKIIRFWFDPLR